MSNFGFFVASNFERQRDKLLQEIASFSKKLNPNIQFEGRDYSTNIKSSLAEAYAQLGHLHYRIPDYDKALGYYEKAVAYNHHHFQARNQIGIIYIVKKEYSNAIESFKKIVELTTKPCDDIHKIDALLSIALIYSSLDRCSSDKAYLYVIEAKKINPNYYLTSKVMQQIADNLKNKACEPKVMLSALTHEMSPAPSLSGA